MSLVVGFCSSQNIVTTTEIRKRRKAVEGSRKIVIKKIKIGEMVVSCGLKRMTG